MLVRTVSSYYDFCVLKSNCSVSTITLPVHRNRVKRPTIKKKFRRENMSVLFGLKKKNVIIPITKYSTVDFVFAGKLNSNSKRSG